MDKKKGSRPSKKADNVPDKISDNTVKNRPDNTFRLAALLLAVVILGVAVLFGSHLLNTSPSTPTTPGKVTVWYFYGNGCDHCENVTPYVQSLRQKYPDVDFRILEIYENPTNRDTLVSMNQRLGQTKTGVPVAFVGDIVLLGDEEILKRLESIILNQRKSP
jgi:thiol-disulfide isomerase/thioredoxin